MKKRNYFFFALIVVFLCSLFLTGCKLEETLYDLSVIDNQKINGAKDMLTSAEFEDMKIGDDLLLVPVFVCTQRSDDTISLNGEYKLYLLAYTDELNCELCVTHAELYDDEGNCLSRVVNDSDFVWEKDNELMKGELSFIDNAISLPHAEISGNKSFILTVGYFTSTSSNDEHTISYVVSVKKSTIPLPFLDM